MHATDHHQFQTPLDEHTRAKRQFLLGGSVIAFWILAVGFIGLFATITTYLDDGDYTTVLETMAMAVFAAPTAGIIGLFVAGRFPARLRQVAEPKRAREIDRRLEALEEHVTNMSEITDDLHRLLEELAGAQR